MCGIFGGVGATPEEVRECLNAIRRGDDGITVRQHGDVVMGARRHLVKESGKPGVAPGESDQPYDSDDGRVHLVFNGELYNFQEFRDEMEADGTVFHSTGDTEVFLKLYGRDGRDFVNNRKIDSLFALAIHDEGVNQIVITRDWPGRIPLFYYHDPENRVFLFSSELKGFRPLEWMSLADPVELRPGNIVTLDLDTFELETEAYYRPQLRKTTLPILEVGEELHRLLDRSAKNRTMGDVPICTMLSGGIDSIMTTYYVLSNIDFERVDYRPTSYVMAIDDYVSEDVRRAKVSAEGFKDIGLTLKEIRIPGDQLVEDIPDIIDMFEMRNIKALSVYPLPIYYYLAPAMRDDGFKVTIGGHGVDELMGAYDSWKELNKPHEVQIKHKARLIFMNNIYENMMRRASIIFMNRGPIEARFPFLQPDVCEYGMGIDPKWLVLSPENAEMMLTLISDRGGPEAEWTEQLSGIVAYLTAYLDSNGEPPEGFDDETHYEMGKLLWKFPLIVAGMHAAAESFLPFNVLFNPKLRGQHGSGITSLESKVVNKYRHLGNDDGAIFKSMAAQSFNLA